MKTSLLLLGLVVGAGLASTAHAADVTTRTAALDLDSDVLVAASTAGDGVLSALGSLLSGNSHEHAADSQRDCDRHAQSSAAAHHPSPPGSMLPMPIGSAHQRQSIPVNPASAPPGATSGGGGSEPPTDQRPSLGWQSLLPGSIQ